MSLLLRGQQKLVYNLMGHPVVELSKMKEVQSSFLNLLKNGDN